MAGSDRWTHGTDERAPYILSALFGGSDLILLWSALQIAVGGHGSWLFCAPPLAMLGMWPFLRWNRAASPTRRAVSLLFVLAALAGMGTGSAITTIPLVVVVLTHIVSVFGFGGGVCFSAVAVGFTLAANLMMGRDAWRSLAETIVMAVFTVWALIATRVLLGARQRAADNERLLAELTGAHAKLRRYAARVGELTVAEERARMSREMHDSVGHYLTVINLGLENAQRYRAARPDEAWAEVRQAQQLTVEALADTRRWVRALKPLALEGKAGATALAELARSFEGTGLDVTFQAEGAGPALDEEAELVMYRALQEGLTNAARHSGARRVEVVLGASDGRVELAVTDDGRGAADEEVGGGHGLAGLRQRVTALGGSLHAGSRAEGGFALRVYLPAGTGAGR
ncbi:sensor histidine kinase [Nonomuraea aurantiaca]|uniref:sensor histidine kinase n=1 Tax=Nonomuraea aurantiaca TaxID=2878562 RepID=UPI001CD97571|nr:sensor histidine kinase [Nonomuraea aurantiaca]MCA2227150.1 sensor histidine kinase [Nonomuraea aurantiaca]